MTLRVLFFSVPPFLPSSHSHHSVRILLVISPKTWTMLFLLPQLTLPSHFACHSVFQDLMWQIILSVLCSWPHFLFVCLLPQDPDLYVCDPRPVMGLGNGIQNPECFLCLMSWLGIFTLGQYFDSVSNINSEWKSFGNKIDYSKSSWEIFAWFYRTWKTCGVQALLYLDYQSDSFHLSLSLHIYIQYIFMIIK